MSSRITFSIIMVGLLMLSYGIIIRRFAGTTDNRHKYDGRRIQKPIIAISKAVSFRRNFLRPLHPT